MDADQHAVSVIIDPDDPLAYLRIFNLINEHDGGLLTTTVLSQRPAARLVPGADDGPRGETFSGSVQRTFAQIDYLDRIFDRSVHQECNDPRMATYGLAMGNRRIRGTGTIFRDQRGYWTVALPMPSKDGKRRRKVKRFRDHGSAIAHLRDFERSRSGSDVPASSEYPPGEAGSTVGEWFDYWLTECVYP